MRRINSKHIIVILAAAIIIVTAAIVYRLISIQAEDASSAKEYNSYKGGDYYSADMNLLNIVEEVPDDVTDVGVAGEDVSYKAQREIWKGTNFNAFKNTNSDFIGIISIPFLKMWYPMVQNKEDSYDHYLSYSFNGDKNAKGTIFLDYTFSNDFSDNHAIVFGHNMKNLSMFGSLHTLFDSEYKKPIYVYIYQPNQILVYEVFAAYTTPAESSTYNAFLVNSEHYESYISEAIQSAVYKHSDKNVTQGRKDQKSILTLSTCHANDHSDYTVVQCMLIERIGKDEE